jgi:hypothetical protein
MHTAAILNQEIRDVRAENAVQKQKLKKTTKRVAHTEGFSTEEGIESRNQANEAQNAPSAEADASASQPIRRAPPVMQRLQSIRS